MPLLEPPVPLRHLLRPAQEGGRLVRSPARSRRRRGQRRGGPGQQATMPSERVFHGRDLAGERRPPVVRPHMIEGGPHRGPTGLDGPRRTRAMGEMITYASDGATATGYLAVPAPDKARGRGVVVIQEWWGLVDHIKRVADKFAARGLPRPRPRPLPRRHDQVARRGREAPHGPQHRAGGKGPAGRHRAAPLPHRPPGRHRGLLHGRRLEPVRGLRQPEGRRRLRRLLRRSPEDHLRLRPPHRARSSATGRRTTTSPTPTSPASRPSSGSGTRRTSSTPTPGPGTPSSTTIAPRCTTATPRSGAGSGRSTT